MFGRMSVVDAVLRVKRGCDALAAVRALAITKEAAPLQCLLT